MENQNTGGGQTLPTTPTSSTTDGKDELKMNKDELRGILKGIEDKFQSKFDRQEEQIDMLTQAADKRQMNRLLAAKEGPKISVIRLNTYKDKIVNGWEKVIDEVFKDGNGVWHEKQIWKIHTIDGETVELKYNDFHRIIRENQIEAEVVSRTNVESGGTIFKVRRKDNNEEVEIDSIFIN